MKTEQEASLKPRMIRTGVVALAAVLLLLAFFNFYRFASSSTDENFFGDPPSQLMATASTANLAYQADKEISDKNIDSLRMGDLIIAIQGIKPDDLDSANALLSSASDSGYVDVLGFSPSANEKYSCRIATGQLPDDFLKMLPNLAHVFKVFSGGVSDIAGIKKGDLIYRINEQQFANVLEADSILRFISSGETILYDIIRQGRYVTIPVTVAKFGVQLPVLLALLTGLVFLACGLFVGYRGASSKPARLLALSFIGFGFAMMTFFCQRAGSYSGLAELPRYLASFALLGAMMTWIQAKNSFPTERPELLQKKWVVLFPHVAMALMALMVLAFWTEFLFERQVWRIPLNAVFIATIVVDQVVRFVYRNERSQDYRRIRRLVSCVSWGAVLVSGLFMVYFWVNGSVQTIAISLLPFLAIPLTCLFVIGRYQLIGVNLHVTRNMQYIIASTIWITVVCLVLGKILLLWPAIYFDLPNIQFTGTSFVVLDVPPDPKTHDFWEKLIVVALALLSAFLMWRVGKGGQKVLDRLFHREKYDISRATSDLAEIMATKAGLDELARGIVEKLAKLMELRRVGVLFFRDGKTCCCQEAFGFDGNKWDTICMYHADELVAEMRRFRSESRLSVDYLPQELRQEFMAHEFRHIIPIRFKNRLVGIFVIGEKLSETPLHLEDLTFLSAVAKQASIAIENAFLHEEVTDKERLKHELNIARQIQMASLPQKTPEVSGLDISGISIPALEVGGDYFDYLNGVTQGLTIIVGDVSGKGTSAALYMSKVQGIIRSLHAFELSPKELFIRANTLLCQDMEKKSFITVLGAFIDTKRRQLVLARAGHLPLFYYSATDKAVQKITPKGLGMGLEDAGLFADALEEYTIGYQTGDIFLFVTDGITEAQKNRGGLEFGEDKLAELLSASASGCAREIRETVIEEVKAFVNNGLPHDDQTIVVVKVK